MAYTIQRVQSIILGDCRANHRMSCKIPSYLFIISVREGILPDSDGQVSWCETCWDWQNLVELLIEVHLSCGGSGGQIGLWGGASLKGSGSEDKG